MKRFNWKWALWFVFCVLIGSRMPGCIGGPVPQQPTYTKVEDPGLPAGVARLAAESDTLYCIGSAVESDAAVLGWLANNGFLESPVFDKLFRPERADEFVYLTHGDGHTIELDYYGQKWDYGSAWPPTTTDRNVVSAFMLLPYEDRLTAIAALMMLRGRVVADVDSSVFVAQFMRTAYLITDCPSECDCTPATEWPPDSLVSFAKNNWREGLGLQ